MRQRASQRVWLFDLDNTLHNASHAIFPQINLNMNAYIARLLGDAGKPADEATVNALRLDYYLRYGDDDGAGQASWRSGRRVFAACAYLP
jgi:FMN phosphatase YigB (HAD superfamily)